MTQYCLSLLIYHGISSVLTGSDDMGASSGAELYDRVGSGGEVFTQVRVVLH